MKEFRANLQNRLDIFLSSELNISRNQISLLIKAKNVSVNDKFTTKPSFKLEIGDKICVNFPQSKPQNSPNLLKFDIDIIYEDDDLIVINKPPNLVVHPAPSVKEPTLVDWLRSKGKMLSNLNGEFRPGIVHRLDKGTSGAMIIAKNNHAHAKLSAQLSNRTIGRIYLALIDFSLKENCVVCRNLSRCSTNRLKQSVCENGRMAKSAFASVLDSSKCHLIAAKLFTGRTHQIRAHLNSISRHILGDNLYGFKSDNDKISRVMLHSYELHFLHPKNDEFMSFCAPIYDDFLELIKFDKGLIDESLKIASIRDIFSDVSKWLCYENSANQGKFARR